VRWDCVPGNFEPWLDPSAPFGHGGSSRDPYTFLSQAYAAPGIALQHESYLGTQPYGQQLQYTEPGYLQDASAWEPFSPNVAGTQHSSHTFNDFTTSWIASGDPHDFATYPVAYELSTPLAHDQQLMPAGPAIGDLPVAFAGAIEPQQTIAAPPAPANAHPPVHKGRIACSNGCGKTFRRAGDCRRHMLKHGPHKFTCSVFNCTKTFYRADKLRSHVKQGHKLTFQG
jgi:hypothetical protein